MSGMGYRSGLRRVAIHYWAWGLDGVEMINLSIYPTKVVVPRSQRITAIFWDGKRLTFEKIGELIVLMWCRAVLRYFWKWWVSQQRP